MKGTLQYVSKDKTLVKSWVVWYNEQPDGGNITFVDSLPLHPDDVEYINAYEDNYHDDLYLYPAFYNNKEVEFNIVDFWETGIEKPFKVAELIHIDNTKTQKTASKEFDDFLESVKAIPDQKPICEYSGLPSVTSYTDPIVKNTNITVELNKDDLVNLIMGFNLYNDLINKYSKLEYGHWTGGHVDKWTWHEWVLEDLSEEELYNIFLECKSYRK